MGRRECELEEGRPEEGEGKTGSCSEGAEAGRLGALSPCERVTEGETMGPLTDTSEEWWATNALEAWAGRSWLEEAGRTGEKEE
jgi:hypothetical protein